MWFVQEEIADLLKAWLAVSLAFAMLTRQQGFLFSFAASLFTVGLGFVFHELAHKFLAQKYGLFAMFRADEKKLAFAIITSFFGFVFAAPGAVVIRGATSPEKYGKVALAGPSANMILALFFLAAANMPLLSVVAGYGFRINAWLALFNLLPFGNLDGAKVLRWSKTYYALAAGIAVLLTF
ncbi:site-2 protease family protein [Candidatus Woesearchaeota archaeon]|nr:MAG: site-2 protease family protein [Candidatus Woesearchaeota archaeon]